MKKEFQCLNSSKQIKATCGRARKPYLKTIKQKFHVSENQKTFWKFRSLANSHQKGVLSPPNVTEHSMNKLGQAQNRNWKQSSIIWNKIKLNYFLESFFIGIESGFFISELQLTSDDVWESSCTIFKTSERSSSNFDHKTTFRKGYSFSIHCAKMP